MLLLSLMCGMSLVSCSADDDTPIFIFDKVFDNSNPYEPDPLTYGVPEKLTVPTLDPADDIDNKLNIYLPTDSVPCYDGNGNVTGYYGYINLGLSKQWAVNDLGAAPVQKYPAEGFKKFSDFYTPDPYTARMEETVTNGMAEINSIYEEYKKLFIDSSASEDTEMSFGEFKKALTAQYEHTSLSSFTVNGKTVEDVYKTLCSDYKAIYDEAVAAFKQAKADYESYMLSTKYAFLQQAGEEMLWGYNTNADYDSHFGVSASYPDDHYKSVPADYSGNAAYDAATNLWGASWATPNKDIMQELISNATLSSTSVGNVTGVALTVSSGKALFIPDKQGTRLLTSSKDDSNAYWAYFYYADISAGYKITRGYNGDKGKLIRPILNK